MSTVGKAQQYQIKALTSATWQAFADLCMANNGAGMGGCWCTWFHDATMAERRATDGREYKHALVEAGRAHAALVFEGDTALGWCEYGSPDELPGIAHRKEVEGEGRALADYRLTCFFVDRRHRRQGVAAAALDGAVALIARAGGGVVEGYPQDTGPKKVASSFLYNGTRAMFERAGFEYDRPKGKNHCVVRRVVEP